MARLPSALVRLSLMHGGRRSMFQERGMNWDFLERDQGREHLD
jgi:hypothetical protein